MKRVRLGVLYVVLLRVVCRGGGLSNRRRKVDFFGVYWLCVFRSCMDYYLGVSKRSGWFSAFLVFV